MSQKNDEIPVGKVVDVAGDAWAELSDSQRPLKLDSPVYEDDIIKTDSQSRVQIEFIDHTRVSQGEETASQIKSVNYNPDPEDNSDFLLNLIKGSFKTITGEIVKDSPEHFNLESPMANISISGTSVVSRILPKSEFHSPVEMASGKILVVTDNFGNEQFISIPGNVLVLFQQHIIGEIHDLSEEALSFLQKMAPKLLEEIRNLLSDKDQRIAPLKTTHNK